MSTERNNNFIIHAPVPIDARTLVSTYSGLAIIPIVYIGLTVYVVDEDAEYRYKSSGWTKLEYGGSSVWGNITGSIVNQTDLNTVLNGKYNTTGGVISGYVIVQDTVEALNFLLSGSSSSSELPTYIKYVATPASSADAGNFGEVAIDENYLYVYTTVWKRIPLETWSPPAP